MNQVLITGSNRGLGLEWVRQYGNNSFRISDFRYEPLSRPTGVRLDRSGSDPKRTPKQWESVGRSTRSGKQPDDI